MEFELFFACVTKIGVYCFAREAVRWEEEVEEMRENQELRGKK
jgi:hypothetical protein